MNDSAGSQTTKRLLPLVVMMVAIVLSAFALSSAFQHSSINDGRGRYQMCVTDNGTIVIMDTVTGGVANVYKADDYNVGGRALGGKQGAQSLNNE